LSGNTNSAARGRASARTNSASGTNFFAGVDPSGRTNSAAGLGRPGDTNSLAAAAGQRAPTAGATPGREQSAQPSENNTLGSQTREQSGTRPGARTPSSGAPATGAATAQNGEPSSASAEGGAQTASAERLRQFVQELGANARDTAGGGPLYGGGYLNWSERLRDIEQIVDAPDVRNQIARARERLGVFRGYYRDYRRISEGEVVRQDVLTPLTQARVWIAEELARLDNSASLVPLDRDPVPDKYTESVRKYYEKLGEAR
jgi:hypothetical protein